MKRRHLILVIGVFGFLGQVESLPAYHAVAQSSGPTKEQAAPAIQSPRGRAESPIAPDDQSPPSDKIKRSEWVQIFISGFVALVVLWQAWIYNEQRKMADRQMWQTYLAERAYIGLLTLEVSDLRPHERPLIHTHIINGGRTPAWNVSLQIKWSIGTEEVVRLWTPRAWTSPHFLAAGQTNTTKTRLEQTLSERNIQVIEDESMQLFVTVQCRYVDFKGEQRDISFPGVYDRIKGNFVWHKQTDFPKSN